MARISAEKLGAQRTLAESGVYSKHYSPDGGGRTEGVWYALSLCLIAVHMLAQERRYVRRSVRDSRRFNMLLGVGTASSESSRMCVTNRKFMGHAAESPQAVPRYAGFGQSGSC